LILLYRRFKKRFQLFTKSCGFIVVLKILRCPVWFVYTIVIIKISIRIWCEIKLIILIFKWIILIFITIVKFVWKFCHFLNFFWIFFGLKEKKKTNLLERKIDFFSFWIFDFFFVFLYMHETNTAKWMQGLIYKFSVLSSS